MSAQPARVFTPNRTNSRRKLFNQVAKLVLVFLITLFLYLIFTKYLKTPLLESLKFKLINPIASKEESFAAKVAGQVDPTYFNIFEAKTDTRGDAVLTEQDGSLALFSKDKSIGEQVYSLQEVVSQARINGKKLKKIDLRFDKVYVEYR